MQPRLQAGQLQGLGRKKSIDCMHRVHKDGPVTGACVELVEVGPRDGLQNESTVIDTASKIGYIERLVAAGVRRIEATSFVHPERVPQLADAESVMAGVPRVEGVKYIGLVVNRRGLDRALAAGVDELNVVVVATDTFSQKNQGMTVRQAQDMFADLADTAHSAGVPATLTIGAAFGCPFEGEVSVDRVLSIVRRAITDGAAEVALADTIGVAVPNDVRMLVEGVRAEARLPVRCHFHNTRNTGYANALAAIDAGVAAIDASCGGIGGCPFAPAATGNIATEDLLYALNRTGIDARIDIGGVLAAAAFIEAALGRQNPALLGRAGVFPPPAS